MNRHVDPSSSGRDRSSRLVLVATALLALVALALGLGLGAVPLGPGEILASLGDLLTGSENADPFARAVLLELRLPRAALALAVGATLAVCGVGMQAVMRNPLADPTLLGVSGGGALFAALATVLGAGLGSLGQQALLPLAAFLGCLLATALVYRLGTWNGRSHVATLLLAGIAINALTNAGVGVLVTVSDEAQLRSISAWLLGSLGGATPGVLAATLPLFLVTLIVLPRWSRALNVLLLGESEAGHLGVDVQRLKRRLVLVVALGSGAAVAAAGIIGFVGLVVPHLLRLCVGPDHRLLLPGSALLGGALLLLADLAARLVMPPAELPIGVITAFLGAPAFLGLLVTRRRQLEYA